MRIRVENGVPQGSPQTMPEGPAGWVEFIKTTDSIDYIRQTVDYIYDEDLNQVIETVVSVDDVTESVLEWVRSTRDYLLKESDWTQVTDSPLTDTLKTQWATYRQALRDLPDTCDTSNVVYPTKP